MRNGWERPNTISAFVLGGVLGALGVGGCTVERVVHDREELLVEGRSPEVKPAGINFVRDPDLFEVGPPPYGYILITGEPLPGWKPGQAGGAGPRGGMAWTFLGPKPMSSEYWSGNGNAGGHVSAIAPHPTDPNVCYIGASGGGVWKTIDGGVNWTPMTDTLPILNSGALAIDPSNPETIFYGTGQWQTGSTGAGIFKSTDGGVNWTQIATASNVGNQISRIIVHPTNPSIIHVTGTGGYYRTLDGGATWSRRTTSSHASMGMSSANPNVIYVGRSSQGVYKSTDGGTTLVKLTGGLPTSGFSAVFVDVSRSNPNVLYAALVSGGGIQGMYRSADAGVTWVQKANTPNFPSPQGAYNAYVAVDPADENTVFVGGVDPRYAEVGISKTTNGGDSWTEVGDGPVQTHPDHHVMAFGPGPTIWEGNDGGIYKSTNGGANWINLNTTLAASQMYNLVQHPTSTFRYMGGTQDNGTPERTANSFTWPQLQVGDGGFSVFDPTNTTRRYTTYVYLTITRWSGGSGTGITGPWGSDPVNFIAPMVGDPNSSTTILGGTNRIWRTTNSTGNPPTWTAISTSAVGAGGTINAIAVATGASNTIYSGSTSGKVYVTTDAALWEARSTGLPSGQISDIVISPTDPATAYVSYFNTSGNRILRTSNYGVTWTPVSGTLPAGVGVRALAVDWAANPARLFVGAGAGVWHSLDHGATWTHNDASLPNAIVDDLTIHAPTRVITAGTYGRGAWQAALPVVCAADFNGDGFLNGLDYDAFVFAYEAGDASADFDGDGFVTGLDFDNFVYAFEAGC